MYFACVSYKYRVPYLDISCSLAGEPTHLVRYDIEGSEFSFIDNYPSLLQRTKRLAIEFHHDFGDHSSALVRLRQLGIDQLTCTSRKDHTSTWYLLNSCLF